MVTKMTNGNNVQISFKNSNGETSTYSLVSLKANKCLEKDTKHGKIITLTPEYIDLVSEDQVLVDMYGNKKTKAKFLKERNGNLWPGGSRSGGATIYGILIDDKK